MPPSQRDNGCGKCRANANVPYLIFHVLFGGQGYFCPHLAISRPRACPFPQRTPCSQAEVGGQGWGTRSRSRIALQSEQHTPRTEQGVDTGGPPPLPALTSFGALPAGLPGCPQACFRVAGAGWGWQGWAGAAGGREGPVGVDRGAGCKTRREAGLAGCGQLAGAGASRPHLKRVTVAVPGPCSAGVGHVPSSGLSIS